MAWHRNYLVLVCIRLCAFHFDLMLVLRIQFFECLRETLYKHALEHLEAVVVQKKNGSFFSHSTVNAYLVSIIDLFEGL